MCLAFCAFLLLACHVQSSVTQNIETRAVTLLRPNGAGTGSTKQQYGASFVVGEASRPTLLYVGAPKFGYSPKSISPGAVYNCWADLASSGERVCSNKMSIGKSGSLGLTMAKVHNQRSVVACAPQYSHQCPYGNEGPWTFGSCFTVGSSIREITNPCAAVARCPTMGRVVVDMMFVVDESGSVRRTNFGMALDWINNVLGGFRSSIDSGDVRVGVVKYASSPTLAVALGARSFAQLTDKVNGIRYGGGGTSTHWAIDEAVNEFKAKTNPADNIPRLMIVMTDGQSDEHLANLSAINARAEGITMVAVGIGNGVRQSQLLLIADQKSQHVLKVDNFNNLNKILGTLTEVIKQTASVQLEGSVSNETSRFTSCMYGFSTHTSQGGKMGMGAVGAFDRAGSFAVHDSLSYASSAALLNLTHLEEIMSPENITHLRESYLGYSTTSGRLVNPSTEFIVSGSPRYHSKGQVVILKSSEVGQSSSSHYTIHPYGDLWQLGSYFGHSVLALDLNGDSYDDLLVSAPLYSGQVKFDQGRVFVYINNPRNPGPGHWESSSYSPTILSGSDATMARFGLSMATVGDVDRNGFNDVIIGAPGEAMTPSKSGAVYVYYSGSKGLSEAYKQRIEGSSVAPSLVNFGYSLGGVPVGGADVDGNQYPDVLVGAPSSDRVVVLRARPIVEVVSKVTLYPPAIDVIKCLNDVTTPCAWFETCVRAVARDSASGGYYDMVTGLTLDSLSEFNEGSRIALLGNDSTSASQIVTSSQVCRNYSVRLKGAELQRETGLITPIRVTFSYDLSPQHKSRHLSPIIDPLQVKSSHADWLIDNGCPGNNATCNNDLSLRVSYSIQPDSQAYVIKNGDDVLSVDVTISNGGPNHVFSTKLEVTSPMVVISQVISSCADLSIAESSNGKAVLVLKSAGSILPNGGQCKVTLRYAFESLARNASADNLVLRGRLYSGYQKAVDSDPSNNIFNFERKVKYDVTLISSSTSSRDTVIFNHTTSRRTIHSIDDTAFPPPVKHSFTIYNQGSQRLSSSSLTFKWTDKTLTGYHLLYLYHFTCLPASKCICDFRGAINRLGIPLTNNTRFNHSLRFPPSGQKPLPVQPSCGDVACGTIRCHVTDLNVFTSLSVEASFLVWIPSLPGGNVDTSLTSSVLLNTSSSPIFPAENYFTQAFTKAKSYQAPESVVAEEGMNIWAIIGGILGGLALLALVIFAFYKAGFFNSKYKDRLEEAREAENEYDMVQEAAE